MIGREYLDRLDWIARAFGSGVADDVAFYAETGKTLAEAERMVARMHGYEQVEDDTLEVIAARIEIAEESVESRAQRALAHGF